MLEMSMLAERITVISSVNNEDLVTKAFFVQSGEYLSDVSVEDF